MLVRGVKKKKFMFKFVKVGVFFFVVWMWWYLKGMIYYFCIGVGVLVYMVVVIEYLMGIVFVFLIYLKDG